MRGCRVVLVLRVHEQLLEWLQESAVARQETACMPGPVARQYVLGEGQVAGGKICGPKPAVAAGELAVDEPVVREEKAVAERCVVGICCFARCCPFGRHSPLWATGIRTRV